MLTAKRVEWIFLALAGAGAAVLAASLDFANPGMFYAGGTLFGVGMTIAYFAEALRFPGAAALADTVGAAVVRARPRIRPLRAPLGGRQQ